MQAEQIEHLILARYYYSYGVDYMSDTQYEAGMKQLREHDPNHWLHHVHWSNDPLPLTLLTKYKLPQVENKLAECLEEEDLPQEVQLLREDYFANYEGRFQDTAQKSINMVQDYNTIYKALEDMKGTQFHVSIKADGQNFTAIYFKGHLVFGRTKGRTGNPMDITKPLRIILPKTINTDEDVVIISGELVCYKESLPYLRSRYRQAFKMTRSAVSTLLRGGLDTKDVFDHLKALVFKVRSEHLTHLSEEFKWAKMNGFNIPAHGTFTYNTWEDMQGVLTYFTPFKEELPYSSDGLVIAINDNNTFYAQGDTEHHYLGNMAIKVGVWHPGYYVGIVKEIKWSISERSITPEAVIEPVTIDTGAEVTSIPIDHIARMVKSNILPGSEIYFKIIGDAKIALVHREEELENMTIDN